MSVLYMESGRCVMRAGSASVTVEEGCVGLLAGLGRFEFAYDAGIDSTAIWCEGFLPEMSPTEFESRVEHLDPVAITPDMRALVDLGLRTGQENSNDMNAYRDTLGLALCRLYLMDARRLVADRGVPPRILRAKQLIEDNLGSDTLTIEAIAGAVGLTPQHLNTAFRRAIGQTPGRYLWQTRAARARHLLVHTPLPLAQICFDCGYSSLAHFSRSIRRAFGLPPGRLRATRGYAPSSALEPTVRDVVYE